MTDMPAISFAELQKGVKKLGFRKVRQKGSHIRFVHQDGRRTTIPDHGSKDVETRHALSLHLVRKFFLLLNF